MKSIRKNPRGLTLVEMLLYVTISSVILLSLSLLLTFLLGSRVKNQSIADVNMQGQQVMQLITQTVRNAKSIDSPGVGQTSNSLSVTVMNPLLSPTVFDVASGTLRIKEGSGVPVLLTNSHVAVSSFLVQNISATTSTDRIVRVSFTIDHNNANGRNENSFTKSFTGSATLRQ